jgi:hypothetical protein
VYWRIHEVLPGIHDHGFAGIDQLILSVGQLEHDGAVFRYACRRAQSVGVQLSTGVGGHIEATAVYHLAHNFFLLG